MKILNIELANVEQTDLGFEHWVDVTYQVPILKNEYTVKLGLPPRLREKRWWTC